VRGDDDPAVSDDRAAAFADQDPLKMGDGEAGSREMAKLDPASSEASPWVQIAAALSSVVLPETQSHLRKKGG